MEGMETQRLTWTGEGTQMQAQTSWGSSFQIGGDVGGQGSSPAELLAVALAGCTSYDVITILKKQRQDLRGLEVTTTSVRDDEAPWAFREINMHFAFQGDVDPEKARKAIALAESKYCGVAASIRATVKITYDLEVFAH